jgi:hypothetical protein
MQGHAGEAYGAAGGSGKRTLRWSGASAGARLRSSSSSATTAAAAAASQRVNIAPSRGRGRISARPRRLRLTPGFFGRHTAMLPARRARSALLLQRTLPGAVWQCAAMRLHDTRAVRARTQRKLAAAVLCDRTRRSAASADAEYATACH